MYVWGGSWGSSWGHSWAEASLPPVATLILGAISIVPAIAGSALMLSALSDEGIESGPLLTGSISTDRSDQ
ncbi:hypothetical protein [Mesorhizobium captivum]|uniref:hypothetical protein n=1 Tax=Mesorhizobium captivum TaxID=3072319 RepID=UPI002A24B87D|nr:hypothetical protein [Mesorhizobium sp. VK23E]MDX8513530.1 hypothetical protein [Mesorhizobium sp. VK23E]